jgi:hypothetical protein
MGLSFIAIAGIAALLLLAVVLLVAALAHK